MGTLKSRCVIIGGGDCSAEILRQNITERDFIICADSGCDYALSAGFTPDLLVGDFDSISRIPDLAETVTLPVEKDMTDSMAAFTEGVKRGYRSFLLMGGTGGRFEHTFANILIMAQAVKNGYSFKMADERHTFNVIFNSSFTVPNRQNTQISVFPIGGEARGVTETGFHYPLENAVLGALEHIGISNDVVSQTGTVTVKEGLLLIIETKI